MAYRRANTDRISHLPPEIIEKILILLPCHEAVRTSILSSDWRYKWISMSDLNFGEPWGTGRRVARLIKFITECLLRHQGPIRKFSVQARTFTVGRKLDHWMKLVSEHDIEELQVDSHYGYGSFRSSSCLFNCKTLTRLKLSNCSWDVPPTFEGFMNLKVLKLSNSSYQMGKSCIESLISKCPLLESLSISISSQSNITISAPKIKYLSLRGNLEIIGLEKSPVLVNMSLYLWDCLRDCNFIKILKILGGAPNLEKLTMKNFQYIESGCYRGVLCTTFSHLKVMTLSPLDLVESKGIPLVIELLRSAPNLEKLVIHNGYSHYSLPNKADPDFWQKEYLVGHCFMKLKVVEMGDILCIAPEIEFVKFILSNSPILEKMTIQTHEWKPEILTRMLEQLPTLSRASPQVAVTFITKKFIGDRTVQVKLSSEEYKEFLEFMRAFKSNVMKIGYVLQSIARLFSAPDRLSLSRRFKDFIPAKYRPLYEQYLVGNDGTSSNNGYKTVGSLRIK